MEKMNENRGGISGYLLNEFSMDGKCEVEYNIVDDSDKLVQEKINLNFSRNVFIKYLKMARKRKINYYGDTDKWLYAALSKYPIENKNICIFGSANPWYEAIAIGFGAKSCNVIEYSLRESFDERICYTRPGEKNEIECDFAFSISSFEHDGLGRYGDPINPNGDIEAMEHVRTKIKRNGLLFISVPIGKDKICFNVHRIYGKYRLPLLFKGWELVESFGFETKDYENNRNTIHSTPYQPIFVLRNNSDA